MESLNLFSEDTKSKLFQKIEEKSKDTLKFLRELVRIPSVAPSTSEGEAQRVVIEELRKIDQLRIDTWEPTVEELERYPLHPVRDSGWSYKGRPNVVGLLKGNSRGRTLALNGHIDVVSAEPVESWSYNPWGGEVTEDRMYGRGTSDMKAGVVAMITAAQAIQETGLKLSGDVILESVVEEEYGGGGTLATLLRGYKADAVIIPEPTGASNLCLGTGGSRFFNIRVTGKSEVPQRARDGINAVKLASKVYDALEALDESRYLRLKGKNPSFETNVGSVISGGGRPSNLTIGILRAGDWPATVAGWAEIEGRIGFPPSESGNDVTSELEETISKMAKTDAWLKEHPPRIRWFGARREGYELQENEPIVQTVKNAVEVVTRRNCELFASPAATDASYITPRVNGFGGVPAVIYGPGGGSAHAADEYVDVDDILLVTKVLALSILDWCGVRKD